MSFYNTVNPNFDNLLLQSLMDRLQIRPPLNPPFLSQQSLEDLLLNNLSDLEGDDQDDDDTSKTQLAREESKLEKEIIRTILSGNTESLKPNSGQAVSIGEHHICVGFHEETDSEYRVWEWHGHIMLFDEENGYSPEYIYGNYFERLAGKPSKKKTQNEIGNDDHEKAVDKEEKVTNLGLKELIDSGDSSAGRVLHRNVNAGSSRLT